MALDTSIYRNIQLPQIDSPMDVASKALTMRQLMGQVRAQEQEAAENAALKGALSMDEKGNVSLSNLAGLVNQGKVSPLKAMSLTEQVEKFGTERTKRTLDRAKTLAWSVTPENYLSIRQQAISEGLPNAEFIPEQYSDVFVKKWQLGTLDGEKQLAQMNQERSFGLEERKIRAQEKAAANTKAGPALTPAQKKVDEEFAKEYNDFINRGGYADVQKNVEQLREVKKLLGEKKTATGPIIGTIGSVPFGIGKGIRDIITPEGAAMQDRVEEVVQRNLRLILGAQFTEREGQRLIERAYNPRLSEEENAKRVGALLDQIEKAANAKMQAAKFYEQHGTLQGFEGSKLGEQQSGDVQVRFQGKILEIPRSRLQEALKDGAEEVR